MCGKNGVIAVATELIAGSPPRVREKLAESFGMQQNHQDHPRVCGKNPEPTLAVTTVPGSPPRVREKLDQNDLIVSPRGITPACAGKTL